MTTALVLVAWLTTSSIIGTFLAAVVRHADRSIGESALSASHRTLTADDSPHGLARDAVPRGIHAVIGLP